MLNFDVVNPTRILFGTDHYHQLPSLISAISTKKKIMIAYGGGSIFKNGIYEKVASALKDFQIVQFGGIEANPQFNTLIKAAEICRTEDIDFILAVGGGSVIDGVKFICGATKYAGDPWDVLTRKEGCLFTEAISFGTVLTLPATGSEANSGAVISRDELKEKRTMGGPLFFPKFSICDPTAVASLPKRQIANGITDAYMHTLEQYLTYPTDNLLQEREAEAILSTLLEIGPKVIEEPGNYKWASNLMWTATHALNGNLRCGVPTDWTTHMIGHELTAIYGIDHARTLAIIAPRLYENQFENKKEKLAQYGKRVLGLSGTNDDVAHTAISKTEEFFQSLGIETKINAYTKDTSDLATEIKKRFVDRGWEKMGERQAIEPNDVFDIVQKSI
jgi:NADP-dependent alcohol dehydrogenase|tara:strand:+ start:4855 stop:6024 length:1170 start_codon:yes stop_codon:yes gene_type:complete